MRSPEPECDDLDPFVGGISPDASDGDEWDPDYDPLLALADEANGVRAGNRPVRVDRPGPMTQVIDLLTEVRDELRLARPAFYSTPQFASRCGVTPDTVRRWVRAGKVRAVKRGEAGQARLLIPAAELIKLFAEGVVLDPGRLTRRPTRYLTSY